MRFGEGAGREVPGARTSRQREGRAGYIEEKDRELGGFASIFAKLPESEKVRVLQGIAELKRELGESDPQEFMGRVRALAALYGSVVESIDPQLGGNAKMEAFRVKLGEIEGVAEELLSLGRSERPEELEN